MVTYSTATTATEAQFYSEFSSRYPEPEKITTYKSFSIGDRVVAIKPPDGNNELLGKEGEVVEIHPDDRLEIRIRFNERYSGWDCEAESLELAKDLRDKVL